MHSNHQVKSAGALRIRCAGTLNLKVVNKTVTNTLHGINFQASNSRNRLVKL